LQRVRGVGLVAIKNQGKGLAVALSLDFTSPLR
jgi:hypothetical protein